MGKIPKAYPSYSEILRNQLGSGSFGSISASKDKDTEARISLSDTVAIDLEDVEALKAPDEMADAAGADRSAKGMVEPASGVDPPKKKKKKKNKSSTKAVTETGGEVDLAERDREIGDRSADGVKGPRILAEDGRAGSLVGKRKEPTDGRSLEIGEKGPKRSRDSCSHSSEEIALPTSRLLPWGGSEPPSDRLVPAAHRRDLVSQTSCISAAATDRFDKFRRYMADRDKREEKLILHSAAFGTLESMDVLKDLGMPIPKELIDTLSANEANFREEMEEVTVEAISEQDLVLPRFPSLEASLNLTRSDSSAGNVDPPATLDRRSSGLTGEPSTKQGNPIGDQELVAADSEGMRADEASGAASYDLVAED
ncbi:hypothetical protein Bca4012_085137 [Brassica carinata]